MGKLDPTRFQPHLRTEGRSPCHLTVPRASLGLCVTVSAFAADASLIDDFDQFPYQWRTYKNVELTQLTIPPTDPLALPGQTTVEGVLKVDGPRHIDVRWPRGQFCHKGRFDREREIELGILTTVIRRAQRRLPRRSRWAVRMNFMPASTADPARTEDVDATAISIWAHFRCGIFTSCVTTTCRACRASPTMGAPN
jgi:hypothetical protein